MDFENKRPKGEVKGWSFLLVRDISFNKNKYGIREDERSPLSLTKKDKLTQQNDEKNIPTYSHGTRTPEISLSSKHRTEPGKRGKLFRFQPDFTYGSEIPSVTIDEALGKPLANVPDSISAP